MDVLGEAARGAWMTAIAYLAVLVAVRVVGRRTVSQMSAFDVVVTIALGSLLAQTSTSGTALIRGLVAVAILLLLQAGIGWARRRFARMQRWVEFAPRPVIRDGDVDLDGLVGGLRGPQMTEGELDAKLRERGVARTDDVRVAIIEPTGGLSVLRATDADETPRLWTPTRG
jgi:uncharacterized membrane protein YcaP (DUF421 family)